MHTLIFWPLPEPLNGDLYLGETLGHTPWRRAGESKHTNYYFFTNTLIAPIDITQTFANQSVDFCFHRVTLIFFPQPATNQSNVEQLHRVWITKVHAK